MEGRNWTQTEYSLVFFHCPKPHSQIRQRVLEHKKFQRERMMRLQRHNTQKNRGIPYLEVTITLHKIYVALANPHPVTAN